jgi:hypothetical protein
MSKHQQQYEKIKKFKQRFRKLPSEAIRYRLGAGSLTKEAEMAYREVLKERGEQVFNTKQDSELT